MAWSDELVPVEDFRTFLTPYAVDAPDDVLDHAIMEAVVWLCRESRILEDSVEIAFQPNVRDYMLMIPEDRELIALDFSREYLRNLSRGDHVDITQQFFTDLFGMPYARPTWIKDGRYPVAEFQYPPHRCARHHMWYSWTPKRDFCGIPRILYEEWMECLRHKALYFLYSMPSTEWYNMQAAQLNEQSAEKWMEKARLRRFANYSQADRRIHARPFVRRNGWYYGGTSYLWRR